MAIVTHIGVIRLLLSMAFGIPVGDMKWRWAIDNTSISSVETEVGFGHWRSGQVEIVAINDNQHIKDMEP
jgi:broad specificity phosphatase PhoE